MSFYGFEPVLAKDLLQLRLDDGLDHRFLLAVLGDDAVDVEGVAAVGAAVVGRAVDGPACWAQGRALEAVS